MSNSNSLMDKQQILDELRRRSGGAQQEQTPMMDKQQILDYLRQRSSAQQQGTGTFAPVRQMPSAKDFAADFLKKESTGYFQAGMLDDKDKNIAEKVAGTYVGTAADVSQNVYSSGLGMGEKFLDFLASIAPYLAAGSQWSETAISAPVAHRQAQQQMLESNKQLASDFVEKDLYNEDEIARKIVTDPLKKHTGIDADTDSVLGEKSDAVVQSLAQMALTAAMGGSVPWWVVTGTTSLGGEAENAVRQGASLDQAVASGLVSAGAEVLSEKLFGGSGLGEKGFLNLDVLTKKISNKVVKTLLDYGVDMAAEGAEEVVSSIASNLGSALYREENLSEILFSEEALQEYLDSFISGAAVGGLMNVGKVGSSVKNKTDYRNGLTAQEQKVFDQQYNAAVKDAEKGGKLTREQRAAIYDAALESVMAQQHQSATQSGETAKPEKVTTQAETGAGGQQTAQTVRQTATSNQQTMTPQQAMQETIAEFIGVPSVSQTVQQTATSNQQTMTPQQAMLETIAEIIGVPSVSQAVESYRESGTVTNKQAEAIASDANAVQELLELAGIAPQPTKSKTRAAVKQAVAKLAQETVSDNAKIASESTGADATIAETVVPTDSTTTARPEIRNDEAWEDYQRRLAEWEARQNQTGGFSSVGAANAGFSKPSPVDPLIEQYGEQDTRPGDRRYVEIPTRDASGNPVSVFVGNAFGSYLTTDSFAETIQRLVLSGELSNLPMTNEQSLQNAAQSIVADGVPHTLSKLQTMAEAGRTSPEAVAEGVLLYRFLLESAEGQTGDARTQTEEMAADLFVSLKQLAAAGGRSVQLFSLFRQLTPDGQVRAITEEIERYVGRMKRLNLIPQDYALPSLSSENPLFHEFADASEAERRAATDADKKAARRRMAEVEYDIYKFIAAQIPATMQDKWDAWRHLSMLGNVKTQGRNFFGTAAFMPYRAAKQAIGSIIEKAIPQDQRTKAVVGLSKADRSLLEWAKQDRDTPEVDRALRYTARLGESPAAAIIEDHRTIYTNKHLESVRKFVRKIPAKADLIFKRAEYASALAGFLKARGYTEQDILSAKIPETVLNEGRQYAVDEAMKATFNDCNALSDAAAKLRVPGEGTISKVGNVLLQGAAPYRRTTANLAVRGVEYSPTGLINGLWESATKVKSGKITAAQAIDDISAGLTGSLAFALGVALSGGLLGLRIRGSFVEDEEKEAGAQPYSLEVSIGGETTSYRMDWIGPAALPLFMGANVRDAIKEAGEDVDASLFAKAVSVGWAYFEPVVDISVLSAIGDTLLDARYAPDGFEFPYVVANMATSYFTQGVPQLARQLVQAIPANERQTKVTGTDPVTRSAERMLGNFPVIGELFKTDKLDEEGNPIPRGSLPERLVDSFLSLGKTKEVDTAKVVVFDTVSGLKAEDGYSNVRPVQKYEAVAGSDKLTEEEKEAALKSMMDDKMEAKLEAVLSKGFDTQDFADSYRIYLDAKKKADAVKEIQNELGVNRAVATQIYEIYNPKPEKTK